MDNSNNQSQGNLQSEITRHLCQAHAVQIKGLQNSLSDVINQTTKALEDGQPELAQSLWKQVVQNTQNISRLFNQTAQIMSGANVGVGQYGSGRRFTGGYGNFGGSRNRRNSQTKQLDRIARKVDELVAANS